MKNTKKNMLRHQSALWLAALCCLPGLAQSQTVKPGWDAYFNTPNARTIGGGQFCWGNACGNSNSYQLATDANAGCVGNPGSACSNQFSWQWHNGWVASLATYGGYKYFGLQNTVQSAPQVYPSPIWPLLDDLQIIKVELRGQFCGGNEAYARVPHYLHFVDPDNDSLNGEINVDLLSHVGPWAQPSTMAIANPGGGWTTEYALMLRSAQPGSPLPPPEKRRVFQFPGVWSIPANGAPNNLPCRGGASASTVGSAPWTEFYINVPFLVSQLRNSGVYISPRARYTGGIIGGVEFWSQGSFGEVQIRNHVVYVR